MSKDYHLLITIYEKIIWQPGKREILLHVENKVNNLKQKVKAKKIDPVLQ